MAAPVSTLGRRTLLFVLRASSHAWSGRNHILLESEGLRQGSVAWANQVGAEGAA